MNTSAQDYLELPYHIDTVRSVSPDDRDAGWVAEVRELKGCIAQGRTPDELMANVRSAIEAWIEDALSTGDRIPQPQAELTQSGKVLVRMPRSLHSGLAAAAEREGVSLNQFVVSLLSGTRSASRDTSRLTGKFFHIFDAEARAKGYQAVQKQGRLIEDLGNGRFVVEFFDWLMGQRSWGTQIFDISEMTGGVWQFYDSDAEMREAWQHSGLAENTTAYRRRQSGDQAAS